MRKPRRIELDNYKGTSHSFAYAIGSGSAQDDLIQWPRLVCIHACGGIDIHKAKKLQKWLTQAIKWMDEEQLY